MVAPAMGGRPSSSVRVHVMSARSASSPDPPHAARPATTTNAAVPDTKAVPRQDIGSPFDAIESTPRDARVVVESNQRGSSWASALSPERHDRTGHSGGAMGEPRVGASPNPTAPGRPAVGTRIVQRLAMASDQPRRSEEHTSELQSRENLVCRLLLEKKKRWCTESTSIGDKT